MDKYLGIAYKLRKSENFDQYMKAIGVNIVVRKLGNAVTPTVKLVLNENGEYTLITTSTFKEHAFNFKPGEEFETLTPDGRKMKGLVVFEGNKMVETQQIGEFQATITREFSTNHMKAEFKSGNVVSKRYYERTD